MKSVSSDRRQLIFKQILARIKVGPWQQGIRAVMRQKS